MTQTFQDFGEYSFVDEWLEADEVFNAPIIPPHMPATAPPLNILPVSQPVILAPSINATEGITAPLNSILAKSPVNTPDSPEIEAERNRLWLNASPSEREERDNLGDSFNPRISTGKCECGKEVYIWFGHTHCLKCIDAYDKRECFVRRQELESKLEADNWIRNTTTRMTFRNSNRNLEESSPYSQARSWIPKMSNVYIHGPIGCGKTYLARCLLNKALDAMHTICEISGFEFCESTKASYQSKGAKWLIGPQVLLIDDLDKAPWKESNIGWLLQVIDRRRDNHDSTILTSNFDPARLTKQLEQACPSNVSVPTAIFDRLHPCLTLEFRRDTLRKKT